MYTVHKQMHNISMVLKCHGCVLFFFFFFLSVQKRLLGWGRSSNLKKEKLRNGGLAVYCLLHWTASFKVKVRSFTSSPSVPLHLSPSLNSWGTIFSSWTQKRSLLLGFHALLALSIHSLWWSQGDSRGNLIMYHFTKKPFHGGVGRRLKKEGV